MIPCPTCSAQTVVSETRSIDHYVRRRRRCPSCNKRITTAEIIVSTNSDDEAHIKPLGRAVLLPQRDVEEVVKLLTGALSKRVGAKAVEDLLAAVLPGTATPTTGQNHGPDREERNSDGTRDNHE